MPRILLAVASALALTTLAALWTVAPAQAFFPVIPGDIFSGYIEGREAAMRDNYRDAVMKEYAIRQQIANDISAFNISGDWRHVCHAYMLGSVSAEKFLFENDMRCRFYRQ
ncbi:MAG: hypothetical protein LBR80_03990 [Deltaproteobacteria bacterium]|jgi:hypothetical protein|nr:hypothetical protein [Deltaproteobacteria bacterium]